MYRVTTAADDPELLRRAGDMAGRVWPEFMHHDPVLRRWGELYERFPELQFALVDGDGEIVANANCVPLPWCGDPADLPDTGWDWAFTQGLDGHAERRRPQTLSALQVAVAPAQRGRAVSAHAVRAMKAIGEAHGFHTMVVPLRPTLKSRYPLVPMERYITWRSPDGLPFDPWIRTHVREGAEVVKVCLHSMCFVGSVRDWEEWAEMEFPESGEYVVPGALTLVTIDRESDRGSYVEPNVWMWHDLQP